MEKSIRRTYRTLPVWRHRRDRVSVPTIGITLALSLILHVALLWKMPQLRFPSPERPKAAGAPLIVRLAPPPALPRARARTPPQQPSEAPPVPRAEERPRPAQPRVLARGDTAPRSPPPPPPPGSAPVLPPSAAAPPTSRTAGVADLASYVEAQRRARGEPAPAVPAAPSTPPVEDPNARANRIAAANLGLDRKPTFGPVRRSGGVFELIHTGYDYAEFWFYGWNKDIGRDTSQKIEVRKGSASDIRFAVVRRMIVIIRDHEQEDFIWESHRLDRMVTLSARLRDNAGLEAFLLREFYEDPRRPAAR